MVNFLSDTRNWHCYQLKLNTKIFFYLLCKHEYATNILCKVSKYTCNKIGVFYQLNHSQLVKHKWDCVYINCEQNLISSIYIYNS